MKKGIYLLGLLMIMALGVIVSTNVKAGKAYEKESLMINKGEDFSEEFENNQAEAVQSYNNLLQYFRESDDNKKGDTGYSYCVDGIYANGFPEYYAGAYINTQGKLVVLLTKDVSDDDYLASKEEINRVCMNDNIIFSKAAYSYSQLVNTMTRIYDYCNSQEYLNMDYNIFGYEIRDYGNTVLISVDTEDSDILQVIKDNIGNAEMLQFAYQKEGDIPTSTINCGDAIGKSSIKANGASPI